MGLEAGLEVGSPTHWPTLRRPKDAPASDIHTGNGFYSEQRLDRGNRHSGGDVALYFTLFI